MSGFNSYIRYSNCFNWAYKKAQSEVQYCIRYLTVDFKMYKTADGQLYCVKI